MPLFSLYSLRPWARVLCLVPLLAGCATSPPAVRSAAPQLESFHLVGRVSVRYDEQGFSGSIDWHHSSQRDEVALLSPLGQGVAQLTRTAGGVTLVMADQRQFAADDVESLTESVLGWRLPLTGLRDWVQARPVAGLAAEVRHGDGGEVEKITQAGWQIEYPNYKEFAAGHLPGRIFMENPELRLKLAIDEWQREP